MNLSTRELVLCALCTAVMCVIAPVSIPLAGGIPLSLATFVIMLSGILLGGRSAALSLITYVLLGSVGLPVFSGWKGGIGVTLGITGGYIIGYIFMAFTAGFLYYRLGRNVSGAGKYIAMFVSMVLSTVVLYTIGTAWFIAQTNMNLSAAMAACVIPFLPGDLIKIVAVMLVARPIEVAIKRAVPVSQGV